MSRCLKTRAVRYIATGVIALECSRQTGHRGYHRDAQSRTDWRETPVPKPAGQEESNG